MAQKKREEIRRQAFEKVRQATKLGAPVTFNEFKEKTFHKRWITDQYGKIKNVMGKQIGGQMPSSGPDVLKHIKQYDPDNSSGAFKDALDIMTKLQDATRTNSLMSSIQPLQNILGGGLYGKMSGAGSKAKAQEKAKKDKKEENQDKPDVITELIAAALECAILDIDIIGDLLDENEISKIESAYQSGSTYSSAIMPQSFIDCINSIIPTFRASIGIA